MDKQTGTAHELLQIYNDIDAFLRQQFRVDKHADHGYLIQQVARSNRVVAKYEPQLRAIAQLRNNIVHNPMLDVASPIAYPHPQVIAQYMAIKKALLRPATALSVAIPGYAIYSATLDTPVHKVLKDMDEHIYTHVPILKDNRMFGVFSENTLLSYLADSDESLILKDMKLSDFKDYLPLKAHKGEKFVFLPRKAEITDVYKVFNQAIKARQRIGMVFITEHGQPSEKPLGIITAWDLLSPDLEPR